MYLVNSPILRVKLDNICILSLEPTQTPLRLQISQAMRNGGLILKIHPREVSQHGIVVTQVSWCHGIVVKQVPWRHGIVVKQVPWRHGIVVTQVPWDHGAILIFD